MQADTDAVPSVAQSRRFTGLEGVRGLAALSVVLFHVWLYQTNGGLVNVGYGVDGVLSHLWLGVTAFFVLSGFLLYRPFVHAILHGTKPVELARYARARFLRIIPAYWAALTLAIIWTRNDLVLATVSFLALVAMGLGAFARGRATTRWGRYVSVALIVAGGFWSVLAAVGSISDRSFDAATLAVVRNYLLLNTAQSSWVIVPAWTLALEASFYICLPILALVAARLARGARTPQRRALRQAPLLTALIGVGLVYRLFDHLHGLPILLPGSLDLFALGMTLATLSEVRCQMPIRGRATAGVAAVAVFGLATSIEHRGTWTVVYGPLVGLAFALGISILVFSPAKPSRRPARALAALGTISYGIYLWHWTIIGQFFYGDLHAYRKQSFAANALTVSALAIAGATLSWFLLERRVLRFKDGRCAQRPRELNLPRTASIQEPPVAPA